MTMPSRLEFDETTAEDSAIREAGLKCVAHRTAEIAQRLWRVHEWMAGRLKEPATDQDLYAVGEAARHYRWLAQVFQRRESRNAQ